MNRKPWMAIALLLASLLANDARAQSLVDIGGVFDEEEPRWPGWMCLECRDPMEHPEDFAAFAYNAYFGEDPWARTSILGIPFRVYNMRMQWVAVWFTDVLFDTPSLLPNTMNIMVRLPNGEIIAVLVLQEGPDLPIGVPVIPSTPVTPDGSCSCAGDGGGGGGDIDDPEVSDDEPEVELDDEEEESDGVGVVEIVDPDEDGEFPEFEL